MSYTGQVTAGGPSDVRDLTHATIRKACVSEQGNNAYLVTCRATGEQVLIDAADNPERCLALISEGTGRLDHLVTTHQHWDHVRALAEVAERTGATTYAGAEDADALPLAPDVRLQHGDRVTVGDLTLDVIHLRGHTPGSVALAYADPSPRGTVHLFTGDTLFPGGVGNTKRPEQDFDTLYGHVVERFFDVYGDDTWFYPGHGDDSTLGAERPHLADWRARGW